MDRGRKAEGRGQAGFYAVPVPTAVLGAVHAAVILLIEAIGRTGGHHQAVHALAEFGVALVLGEKIGPGPAIAGLPGLAPVRGVEDTGRGDSDPDLPFIARMRHERVQDQAAAARLPLRPRSVVS